MHQGSSTLFVARLPLVNDGWLAAGREVALVRPHPLLKSLLSVVDSHGILRVVRLGEGAARSSVVAAYELQLSTAGGFTQPVAKAWSALEHQPDDGVLLSQAGSGRIMFAQLPLGEGEAGPVFLFGSHEAPVLALASTRELLLSGGADGCVRLWSLDTGAQIDSAQQPGGLVAVTAVAFVGPLMAAAGTDRGDVAVLDCSGGRLEAVARFRADAGPVSALAARVSPRQAADVAVAEAPRGLDGGGVLPAPVGLSWRDGGRGATWSGAVDPPLLAVASTAGWLHVFSASATGTATAADCGCWVHAYAGAVSGQPHLSFSPDGRYLAVASGAGTGRLVVLDTCSGSRQSGPHSSMAVMAEQRYPGPLAGGGFLPAAAGGSELVALQRGGGLAGGVRLRLYAAPTAAAMGLPELIQLTFPVHDAGSGHGPQRGVQPGALDTAEQAELQEGQDFLDWLQLKAGGAPAAAAASGFAPGDANAAASPGAAAAALVSGDTPSPMGMLLGRGRGQYGYEGIGVSGNVGGGWGARAGAVPKTDAARAGGYTPATVPLESPYPGLVVAARGTAPRSPLAPVRGSAASVSGLATSPSTAAAIARAGLGGALEAGEGGASGRGTSSPAAEPWASPPLGAGAAGVAGGIAAGMAEGSARASAGGGGAGGSPARTWQAVPPATQPTPRSWITGLPPRPDLLPAPLPPQSSSAAVMATPGHERLRSVMPNPVGGGGTRYAPRGSDSGVDPGLSEGLGDTDAGELPHTGTLLPVATSTSAAAAGRYAAAAQPSFEDYDQTGLPDSAAAVGEEDGEAPLEATAAGVGHGEWRRQAAAFAEEAEAEEQPRAARPPRPSAEDYELATSSRGAPSPQAAGGYGTADAAGGWGGGTWRQNDNSMEGGGSEAWFRSSISASAGIAGTAAPAAGAGSFRFVTLPMSQPRATQPAGSQAFGQSLAGGSLDAGDGGGWGADAYNPDPASDEPQDEDGGADDAGGDAQVDLDADAAAEAQDWSQRRYSPLEQAAYLSRQLADLQLEVGGSAQGEGQEQGAEEQLEEGEEEEDGALMPRGAAGLPAPSRRGNNEDVEDAQPHQSLHPHGSRMHAWRHEQLQPIEEEQESRKEEAQAAEQAQEEEGNDDAGAGLGTAAQLPSDSVHVGYSLLPRPEEHEEQVSAAGLWEGFANADVLSGRGMAQAATVEVGARGGVRAAAAPGRPAWPSARLRQSPAGSSHRMQLSGEPPSPLAAAAPAGAASAASGAALGPAIEQAGWTGRQMLMQLRHRKPPVPGTSAATVTHGGVAGLSDVVRPSERSPAVERHKGSWGGETTPGQHSPARSRLQSPGVLLGSPSTSATGSTMAAAARRAEAPSASAPGAAGRGAPAAAARSSKAATSAATQAQPTAGSRMHLAYLRQQRQQHHQARVQARQLAAEAPASTNSTPVAAATGAGSRPGRALATGRPSRNGRSPTLAGPVASESPLHGQFAAFRGGGGVSGGARLGGSRPAPAHQPSNRREAQAAVAAAAPSGGVTHSEDDDVAYAAAMQADEDAAEAAATPGALPQFGATALLLRKMEGLRDVLESPPPGALPPPSEAAWVTGAGLPLDVTAAAAAVGMSEAAAEEAARRAATRAANVPFDAAVYDELPPVHYVPAKAPTTKAQLDPRWVASRQQRPEMWSLWRPAEVASEVCNTRGVAMYTAPSAAEVARSLLRIH